jgi:hypothetical protein
MALRLVASGRATVHGTTVMIDGERVEADIALLSPTD